MIERKERDKNRYSEKPILRLTKREEKESVKRGMREKDRRELSVNKEKKKSSWNEIDFKN